MKPIFFEKSDLVDFLRRKEDIVHPNRWTEDEARQKRQLLANTKSKFTRYIKRECKILTDSCVDTLSAIC